MADCKKYNGSTWEHSLRKLTTATDTITSLPADLYADGNNATVGISGNMEQSGTPTPDNPIMPQGTGERTGNLCLVSQSNSIYYAALNRYSVSNNSVTVTGEALFGFICKVSPNTDYTVSAYADTTGAQLRIREYSDVPTDWSANYIMQPINKTLATYADASFTTDSLTNYLLVVFYIPSYATPINIYNIMLNTGSEPLPYENYGYKIPSSSANTTTPVYLGEVETTRRIKKLVLTGEETSYMAIDTSKNIFSIRGVFNQAPELLQVGGFCTHYKYNNAISSLAQNMSNGDFVLNKIAGDYSFTIRDNSFSNDTDFKQYVQQQYAAGTPVCVWYVLETEETGIVNEPIRKIGDYADTVSGITIPTITGKDTFDVETTLKPSEVSLSYTGWHDASVKEWDGSQWQ